MPFLRNVLHDLVEKRLWPVAVALVAALVAVPIVLGGSSDATTNTPATPTADAGAAPGSGNGKTARAQVVSLEQQAAGKVTREGEVRDPFVQHHQPRMTDAQLKVAVKNVAKSLSDAFSDGSDDTSSGGDTGSGSSSGGSTGTGGASDTAPTPSTGTGPGQGTTTPKAPAKMTYRVNVKFGEDGAMKSFNNVARLTPLPSSDNPFFVFLGVSDDGKTATFLVNGEAVPTGDGHCTPSPEDCQQVTLKVGDLEFFDLQSGTGGVVQYQLELVKIAKVKASTAEKAAAAHARESKAGREVVRELVANDPDALAAWTFDKSQGLLVHKAAATSDEANVPSTVADQAAGKTVGNTSTVLTVPGS